MTSKWPLLLLVLALSCDKPRGADPGLGIKPVEGTTLRAAFDSLPAGGSARMTPLYDNVESWAVRWREIEGAKESLDIVTFILHDDLFGRAFLGLIARKADEGVRVRLLLDSMGTMHASENRVALEAFAALDRRENVDVRAYNPVRRAIPDIIKSMSLLPAVAANHDKIVIVDGKSSIVGGRNFADEYFADPKDDPVVFQDKDMLIEGEAVARALRKAFEREFHDKSTLPMESEAVGADVAPEADLVAAAKLMDAYLREAPLQELPPPAQPSYEAPIPKQRVLPKDDAQALLLFPRMRGALTKPRSKSYPGEVRTLDSCSQAGCRKNDINAGIGRLVNAAKNEIIVENPYLMMNRDGLDWLRRASQRNVKMTLLTNSPVSSDNVYTQGFFLKQWPEIAAQVPTGRIFVMAESHNVHGKMMVVDGTVTVIGSYNLDVLSAAINSEIVAVIWSPELAEASRRNVLDTIARGPPHVQEYTLEREPNGAARLGEDGKPIVKFGAENHCDPSKWTELTAVRKALDVRGVMPDLSPLL